MSAPLKYPSPHYISWVELTPAVQAAAYGANQVVFVATEVTNFTWKAGESAILTSVRILDEADQGPSDWTLYFGRTTFTLGTINEDVTISDADARLLTAVVKVSAQGGAVVDLINSKMIVADNLWTVVAPGAATRSCFVAATQNGTPTYGATTDIKLRLGFLS